MAQDSKRLFQGIHPNDLQAGPRVGAGHGDLNHGNDEILRLRVRNGDSLFRYSPNISDIPIQINRSGHRNRYVSGERSRAEFVDQAQRHCQTRRRSPNVFGINRHLGWQGGINSIFRTHSNVGMSRNDVAPTTVLTSDLGHRASD